ncbi:MAG: hypothetical protein WBB36_16585, partial [Chitinophagales bacterium]
MCSNVSAQTTLTVIVQDENTKKIIPVEVTFKCKSKPFQLSFNADHKEANLSEYEIVPNDFLYDLTITPTSKTDKSKYLSYPSMDKFPVRTRNEDNIIPIQLTPATVLTAKNTIYIRGLVQSTDSTFLKDVTVFLSEKSSITATSDAFGYYKLKIPLSALPAGYSSVRVSFSSGRYFDKVKTVTLDKKIFDYPVNAVMQKKSTLDTIFGKVEIPAGYKSTISYSVMWKDQLLQQLETDSDGKFTFTIDTLDRSTDSYQLLFSAYELNSQNATFQPATTEGIIPVTLTWNEVFTARGPHTISVGALFWPQEYFFSAGYYFHPGWLKNRFAFGANAGVALLRRKVKEYPVLDGSLEATRTDTFTSVLFGIRGRYFWYPYNLRSRVNPYCELAFQLAPSVLLWQPSLGGGVIWNVTPLIAIDGSLRLAYNHYNYVQTFDYFGDAHT